MHADGQRVAAWHLLIGGQSKGRAETKQKTHVVLAQLLDGVLVHLFNGR